MITYDDGVIERMQAECRRERINILSMLKVSGVLKCLNHEDIADKTVTHMFQLKWFFLGEDYGCNK